MLLIVVFICIGFALLFKGGDFLVTGAAGIAQKKNIPAFIVGITLVAFGTSAPELFFNMISALHGNAEFALSNVSGSNLINICLGLGVSAIIATLPITRKNFTKDLTFLFAGPLLIVGFILLSPNAALTMGYGAIAAVGAVVLLMVIVIPQKDAARIGGYDAARSARSVAAPNRVARRMSIRLAAQGEIMLDGRAISAAELLSALRENASDVYLGPDGPALYVSISLDSPSSCTWRQVQPILD